jgi:hypothetical protein
MTDSVSTPGYLKQEFDRALESLEAASAALERARCRYSHESLEACQAQDAYNLAKLVLTSCELRLRSVGITGPTAFRRSTTVLVYSRSETFRNSLAMLLRAHDYPTASYATLSDLQITIENRPHGALVTYLEPGPRSEPLFIERVVRVAPITPVFILHGGGMPSTQWATAHPRIHSSNSIKELITQLDATVGVNHVINNSSPLPHCQGVRVEPEEEAPPRL